MPNQGSSSCHYARALACVLGLQGLLWCKSRHTDARFLFLHRMWASIWNKASDKLSWWVSNRSLPSFGVKSNRCWSYIVLSVIVVCCCVSRQSMYLSIRWGSACVYNTWKPSMYRCEAKCRHMHTRHDVNPLLFWFVHQYDIWDILSLFVFLPIVTPMCAFYTEWNVTKMLLFTIRLKKSWSSSSIKRKAWWAD
jgi:hypothetical protein